MDQNKGKSKQKLDQNTENQIPIRKKEKKTFVSMFRSIQLWKN